MSCEVHVIHNFDKVQKNIFYASLSVTTNPFSFEIEAGYIFQGAARVWPCLLISPASVTVSRRMFVQGSLAVHCYHMKLRRGLDISDMQMIF